MSSSAKFDIDIDQGSDFTMTITIKDAQGNPIDITGHNFTGQIRKTIASSIVEASFSFALKPQTGATLGQVDITLAGSVSSGITLKPQNTTVRKPEAFAYDIESDLGGVVTRWMEGKVNISPEVTR